MRKPLVQRMERSTATITLSCKYERKISGASMQLLYTCVEERIVVEALDI